MHNLDIQRRSVVKGMAAAVAVTVAGVLAGKQAAAAEVGGAFGWSRNKEGELGDGTASNRGAPVAAVGLGSGVQQVSAGFVHTLALKLDGTVWSYGYNAYGQLGLGDKTTRYVPYKVPGLSSIVDISGGQDHSLAVRSDGTVWAWGRNSFGQLGGVASANQLLPIRVPGVADVVKVSAGAGHSLALRLDGTVLAWGANHDGQLGDGTNVSRSRPVPVFTLTGIKQISAGSQHNLALGPDGAAFGWGNNDWGKLGDGSTSGHYVPTGVLVPRDTVAVSAGHQHSLAVRAEGTPWAWGYASQGQLGEVLLTTTPGYSWTVTPQPVPYIEFVVEISAANMHSLARDVNGKVWSWGTWVGDVYPFKSTIPWFTGMKNARQIDAGFEHSVAVSGSSIG